MLRSLTVQKTLLVSTLLGFLSVGCAAPKQDAAAPTQPAQAAEAQLSQAASSQVSQELLVGTWVMKMENMMDTGELSESERQHLSAMMQEMTFAMQFTEDGKVLSSMDDQIVDYQIQGDQVIANGDALKFTATETQLTLTGPDQELTFSRTEQDIGSFANNAFASSARIAKEAEGKTLAGSMNRAQQAYFLENDAFATDLNDLELGIKPETDLYAYSITGATRESFNHAVAKQGELRSYVGGVFSLPESEDFATTQAILCVADTPGTQKLGEPNLAGDEITCPTGSSLVE